MTIFSTDNENDFEITSITTDLEGEGISLDESEDYIDWDDFDYLGETPFPHWG